MISAVITAGSWPTGRDHGLPVASSAAAPTPDRGGAAVSQQGAVEPNRALQGGGTPAPVHGRAGEGVAERGSPPPSPGRRHPPLRVGGWVGGMISMRYDIDGIAIPGAAAAIPVPILRSAPGKAQQGAATATSRCNRHQAQ